MTPKQSIDKLLKCVNIAHYIGSNAAKTIKDACYAQTELDKPAAEKPIKVKPKPLVKKPAPKEIVNVKSSD